MILLLTAREMVSEGDELHTFPEERGQTVTLPNKGCQAAHSQQFYRCRVSSRAERGTPRPRGFLAQAKGIPRSARNDTPVGLRAQPALWNRDLNPLFARRNPDARARLRRQRPKAPHDPDFVRARRQTVEHALARGIEAAGRPVAAPHHLQRDELA